MEELKSDRKALKKFGIIMGLAFLVITLLILIRHKYSILPTSVISLLFFISAIVYPLFLKPFYIFWMKLAFMLGWINTRLILIAMFYLIFTPIGIGLKICGVDLLDRKLEKDRHSYWKKKERVHLDRSFYERQF